jgi:hypothetical protein
MLDGGKPSEIELVPNVWSVTLEAIEDGADGDGSGGVIAVLA